MCLFKAGEITLWKLRTRYTGQWYLTFCSRKGSPTPLVSMLFLFEVNTKSMVDEETSVK